MKNILIIDDDSSVRATVKAMLAREGYVIHQAANGAKGIEVFEREKIDLVICDIIMPEMEGIQCIREIRNKNPAIRIIAISGGGRTRNVEFLDIATKLGADHALKKPFTRGELTSLLQTCLSPAAAGAKN